MANPVLAFLSTVLYCLWLPTSKILSAFAFLLSPLLAVARFLFLPVYHLLHAVYAVLSFPFRVDLLERIQTIYIWVGVAALIGCIAGTILFLVFKFLTSALKIDGAAAAPSRSNGRSVKDFRETRQTKKEPHAGSPTGPRIDKVAALRRQRVSSQPTAEESEF